MKGDIFQSPAQVLVNAVNTVGVMGKGIAFEYKRLFPEMFVEYRKLCEDGKFHVGTLWLYKTENKWVLNFPTKQHWRQPSRIEYIETGLKKFVDSYSRMGIHSIAFPPLGCGNGQLDFKTEVQPLMEKYLRNLPIEVFIYPERESDFVEHLNPKEMKRWMNTEPQSLPFSEVWDDLRELLRRQNFYATISRRSQYSAYMVDDPLGIQVVAGKQKYNIPYETLAALWQQLRSHGFSMRHIAPGLGQNLSYVIPIFAELEYVNPVHVSDRYSNFHKAGLIGLQVMPSAFDSRTQEFEQLTLF